MSEWTHVQYEKAWQHLSILQYDARAAFAERITQTPGRGGYGREDDALSGGDDGNSAGNRLVGMC
jgi:hypothetical protein